MSNIQHTHDIYKKLSPRELQVAQLAKEGKSLKETAALLGVKKSTIGATRGRVMEKLGCQNITACVVSLIEAGIL
jgi:DNA-binding CsgD family transcriptional regulator